jgi:hypothetical protein
MSDTLKNEHRLREGHTEGGSSSGVPDYGNKKQSESGEEGGHRGRSELPATGRGRCLTLKAFQPPTDFFGRPIAVKPVSKPVSRTSLDKATSPIRAVSYKFNEGNYSAVRKPVKIS